MLIFRLAMAMAVAFALLSVAAPARATESLDPSFGAGGVSFPGLRGGDVRSLARGTGGKLVSGGGAEVGNLVARYLSDGARDPTFGDGDGWFANPAGVSSRVNAVAVQHSGKILAAGSTRSGNFTLTRYGADGRGPDPNFGERYGRTVAITGSLGGGAQGLALRSGGRTVVVGYGIDAHRRYTAKIAAYRANGRLDRGFGSGGIVDLRPAVGSAVRIRLVDVETLKSGKILAAGDLGGHIMVVRRHPDGRPDRTFGGGDGIVFLGAGRTRACACSYAIGLEVDRLGRILVAANATRPRDRQAAVLIRLRADGELDRGFGRRGVARAALGSRFAAKDIARQGNGRILLAGTYNVLRTGEARVAAVRFLPNGRADRSFARGGFFMRDFGYEGVAYAALTQHDGRVVIGGRVNRTPSPFAEAPSIYDTAEVFLIRFLQ